MPRTLLSMGEVCNRLDCSDDTVRRLVRDKLLNPPRVYPRLGLRFEGYDVERFIAEQGKEPKPRKKKTPPAEERQEKT